MPRSPRRATRILAGVVLAWVTALRGPTTGIAQDLPAVDEVLNHLDELYRSTSSHAVMEMTVTRERGTRTLTLESWSRGEDSALIVIREPPREAGIATLRSADGLWNYAPRADRLIRIPPGLLSDAWMGSHLTNDDLMRETGYEEDFEAALEWSEREGTRFLQVTLTPRPGVPVVYTELRFLLTAEAWVPDRWEYFDGGELVRTMTFHDVEPVAGRPLPLRLVIQPADEPGERTEMRYLELELDLPVEADLFTRRGLRRVAVP